MLAPRPQDAAQRVLCREAAKDVAGADEQDATHAVVSRYSVDAFGPLLKQDRAWRAKLYG